MNDYEKFGVGVWFAVVITALFICATVILSLDVGVQVIYSWMGK